MREKALYVLRFITQGRATKYLNKLAQQFEDHVLYIDMAEKSIEFDHAIYYFWDMLRDDGMQFDVEYDGRDFNKVVGELTNKYSV